MSNVEFCVAKCMLILKELKLVNFHGTLKVHLKSLRDEGLWLFAGKASEMATRRKKYV